jgi:hypothetical protein
MIFSLGGCRLTRWIILNSRWKSTETDAGVLDCDECSLLQIMLQHGKGPLEDGVHELDSYGTQTKCHERRILASRQRNDSRHVEILGQDDPLLLCGTLDNGFVRGGCGEEVGHAKHIVTE